jgi:protein-L-isoaspartate(D-aspartate) O-methyltransferase
VDRSEKYRSFYAKLICTSAKVENPRMEQAFSKIEREPFAGPGPWWMNIAGYPYVQTPDDDAAYLYQNLLIALDRERGINIGEPLWYAYWLNACDLKEAEAVVQIGGSGYYTAILAYLVGPRGRVSAYEIDESLAARAFENLRDQPHVEVHAQSSVTADLPKADLIYVCAGPRDQIKIG